MLFNRWYILVLLAFVLGAAAFVYGTSEVVTVQVHGKSIEQAQGARRETTLYVIDTDRGRLPLLRFPLIGYMTGVEETYAGIAKGSRISVRIGMWPPTFLGGYSKPYIMAVH